MLGWIWFMSSVRWQLPLEAGFPLYRGGACGDSNGRDPGTQDGLGRGCLRVLEIPEGCGAS